MKKATNERQRKRRASAILSCTFRIGGEDRYCCRKQPDRSPNLSEAIANALPAGAAVENVEEDGVGGGGHHQVTIAAMTRRRFMR